MTNDKDDRRRFRGIDIEQVRQERNIRSMIQGQQKVEDQQDRLLVPERPGHYAQWVHGSAVLPQPYVNSGSAFYANIPHPVTPRHFSLSVFATVLNTVTDYWTFNLFRQDTVAGGVLEAQNNTIGLAANVWTALTPVTVFVTVPWPSTTILAYITIVRTGNPGNLYMAPALYYLM